MSLRTMSTLMVLSLSAVSGCSGADAEGTEGQGSQAVIQRKDPSEPGYEEQKAADKQAALWAKVEGSRYKQGELPNWNFHNEAVHLLVKAVPMTFPSVNDLPWWVRNLVKIVPFAEGSYDKLRSEAARVNRDIYKVTMDRNSDELPPNRPRFIHTLGSVGTIRFEADPQQPYTGLFKGVDYGAIRLSVAVNPKQFFGLAPYNLVPGLGIKFFVDGQPSRNFVAMYSLDGQDSPNFFENEFTNWVKPPKSPALQVLAKAFATVSKDPTKVDVSFLSKVTQDGTSEANTSAPVKLGLVPSPALKNSFARYTQKDDVREEFETIEPNQVLYDVWSKDLSTDANTVHIGKIVLTSKLVASEYGDDTIFFRHERIDEHQEN